MRNIKEQLKDGTFKMDSELVKLAWHPPLVSDLIEPDFKNTFVFTKEQFLEMDFNNEHGCYKATLFLNSLSRKERPLCALFSYDCKSWFEKHVDNIIVRTFYYIVLFNLNT